MAGSRANIVSSFTIIKGPMVPETYAAMQSWDPALGNKENFARLKNDNPLGVRSGNWLRDVVFTLHRRLDPSGRDRLLVTIAKHGCDPSIWKPILLWHMTRDEFLVRHFLIEWLYPRFQEGAAKAQSTDVLPFLDGLRHQGARVAGSWSPQTTNRVACGLLKIAAEFGLLAGSAVRRFAAYHLPEKAFLYLLYAIRDAGATAKQTIELPDWRMYLLSPRDVETEVLRLHQFRKLHYDAAGSLAHLDLPCGSAQEYVQRMMP